MKKVIISLFGIFFCLTLLGCADNKEPLESITITEGPFTFQVPANFVKDEEKSGQNKAFYVTDAYDQGSYACYEAEAEIESLAELTEEKITEDTNRWLKETYLTNAKSEIIEYTLEEKPEGKLLSYTISYNLYSAIVTETHFYYEKNGEVFHLEYYDVEEEGYRTSFEFYIENMVIE